MAEIGKEGWIGAAAGAGAGLLAAMSGRVNGWLKWLMVPMGALAGGVAGNYIGKSGARTSAPPAPDADAKPKSMPEGYLAVDPEANIFAVDSATIARTGMVHRASIKRPDEILRGKREWRALDEFPEFSLNGDPRLEKLKEKARGYRRYTDASSPDYIADVHAREKTVAKLVIADIGETYGSYSYQSRFFNREEIASVVGTNGVSRTAEIRNMNENSFVCRQQAAVACVLLHEAGIPNHLVNSETRGIERNDAGEFVICRDTDMVARLAPLGHHVYVVTDQGNAVVEATHAGKSNQLDFAYKPIVNGVDIRGIVKGDAAIVRTMAPGYEPYYQAYGGHNGDGKIEPVTAFLHHNLGSVFPPSGIDNATTKALKDFNAKHNGTSRDVPIPAVAQAGLPDMKSKTENVELH